MLLFFVMRAVGLLLPLLLLTGCVDSSIGTILGAMTYFRVEGSPSILVREGWVALYAGEELTTPVEIRQTDALGRFNFEVEEGTWQVAGATSQTGPFTGLIGPFAVAGHATTRLFLTIDTPAANAPIAGEVTPTGEIGMTMSTVTFSVTAMTTIDAGAPNGWRWSFGDGATPQVATEASPTVTLGPPGTYTGTVVVYNANGAGAPKSFEYTVAPLPEE